MKLAWRLIWRQRKAGELWILLSGLIVAVATVSAISLFAQRIQATLLSESGALIAADRQLSGSEPIPEAAIALANQWALTQAQTLNFQATAITDAGLQLAAVRAVSDSYPLKGELQISDRPFGPGYSVQGGPAVGEIWLISRLFAVLDIEPGDLVRIGDAQFIASKAVLREPDNATAFFGVNPRILMNLADVEATGAVAVGSRLRYTLLLAGDESELMRFEQQLKQQELAEGFRLTSPRDSSDGIAEALDRGQGFLLLAGSMAVMLAGVALALASARFGYRQAPTVALLKTLGLGPGQISRLYLSQFLLLGLVGIALGLLLGLGLHWVLLWLLRDFFPRDVVAAGWGPMVLGFWTGWLCLLGFALPPIWRLRQIAPMDVLRDQANALGGQSWQWLMGGLAIVALIYSYSRDWQLTLIMVVVVLVTLLAVFALGLLLLLLVRRLSRSAGHRLRLGLASLYRHRRFNALQLMVFSLTLMMLYLMTLIRTDLIQSWQQQIPDDAPNHFVFNVYPEDLPVLEQWQQEQGVTVQPVYPVSRGRLQSIAGVPLEEVLAGMGDRSGEFTRELNLTWSEQPGADNQVVQGQWWTPAQAQAQLLVSIEQSWAQALGVNLGDELVLRLGGFDETAIVDNVRTVSWDSFNPNFYLIFSQPLQEGVGATLLTSFYLPSQDRQALLSLITALPSAAVIEVDAIINQIQDIVDRISSAIEFILLLVLGAGGLVLVASILSTLDVRLRESALLRALGAQKSLVAGILSIEFLALGLLAGLMASVGAQLGILALQYFVFDLSLQLHWPLWLLGPSLGALLIWAVGYGASRKVVAIPPLWVLRQQ